MNEWMDEWTNEWMKRKTDKETYFLDSWIIPQKGSSQVYILMPRIPLITSLVIFTRSSVKLPTFSLDSYMKYNFQV